MKQIVIGVSISFASLLSFAQSSTGQIPCYKLLDWKNRSPEVTNKLIVNYIDAVIDGIDIQKVWNGSPRESLITPQGESSLTFMMSYCSSNANDSLSIVAATFASHLISNQKK